MNKARIDIRSYLTSKFQEYGIPKIVSKCSQSELFYYTVFFKEGMDLGTMAESLMNIARSVYEVDGLKKSHTKKILERIKELKTGDIGLDDFASAKELAYYLEDGD